MSDSKRRVAAGLILAALIMTGGQRSLAADFSTPAMSASEQAALKNMVSLLEQENYSLAQKEAGSLRQKLMADYVMWRVMIDLEPPPDYQSITRFLARHPNWPMAARLRARAERSFDHRVKLEDRLAYFKSRTPVSREGRLALAEALLTENKKKEAAELVREVWIYNNFGTNELRRIMRIFGGLISRKDHHKRIIRLLDEGLWKSAADMYPHVDEGYRLLSEARIKLQRAGSGVDAAVARVPENLRRDPGFVLDRIKWRRQKGLDRGARELLRNPPELGSQGAAWWYERAYQTRELLETRQFRAAYDLVRDNKQVEGLGFAEASWMTGWLALRFVDEPKAAVKHFEAMFDVVQSPVSKARAAYWAGRAHSALKQNNEARVWYQKAATWPTAFYGQQAFIELGEELKISTSRNSGYNIGSSLKELADVALMLCAIDEAELSVPFLRQLLLESDDAMIAIEVMKACKRPDLLVELAKFGVRAGKLERAAGYPIVDLEPFGLQDDTKAPLPLILAVTRQESHFDADAKSSAGATGLMQLMPATARTVGDKIGVQAKSSLKKAVNVKIGSAYLELLLERYDSNLALLAAAYNAGPSRVSNWMERNGDPRRMSRHDAIDWIELVPFAETRNYVHRIIEGYNVYRLLLEVADEAFLETHVSIGPVIPPPQPEPNPRR